MLLNWNDKIEENKMSGTLHMLEIRNSYIFLFGKPKEGNRRLGRLHIKIDLKQVSCESVDWASTAQCHALVNNELLFNFHERCAVS